MNVPSVIRALRWPIAVGLVAVALLVCSAPAQAADKTYTLTVSPASTTWQAGQWDSQGIPPTIPAPGDRTIVKVVNSSSPNPITTTMDMAGLTIDRLELVGNNLTVNSSVGALAIRGQGGSTIPTNGVFSEFPGGVLNLPLAVTGRISFAADTFNTTPNFLTLSGSIEGPSTAEVFFFGETVSGGTGGTTVTGKITRPGDTGSDLGISASVVSGTLALFNSGSEQAIKGQQVAVGAGLSGANPILRLDNPSQIADTTNVFVNGGAGGGTSTFNLNGRSEDVNNLAVNGNGAVDGASNSGFLQVRGPLSMTGGTILGGADPMLQLDGDVTATSSSSPITPATISGRVALKGGRTFTINDGPATNDLAITNVLSDELSSPGASLTKAGTGQLALTPPSSNLYTGGTMVGNGTLLTGASSGTAIPVAGTATVGNGAGAASSATLRFGALNDIVVATPLAVRSDGLADLGTTVQTVASLDMQGGTVQGTGSNVLRTGTVSATSSSTGPARVSARLGIPAFTTNGVALNVTAGASPELELTGGAVTGGGSGGLTKTGAGSVLFSGTNALPGATDVQAGTLLMNGTQTTAVTVGANGTLGGNGTVGAANAAGTLAPGSPSLHTGNLTFSPTGKLAISGPATTALPRVDVAGTTTIQAGAQLTPAITGNPPAGTVLPLITNDAGDAISGQFANAAEGATFTGALNQPFTFGYAKGDGNDLALTAGTVPGVARLPSGGAVADRTKPTLGALTFSASTFRAASSGGSTAQRKKKAKKRPTGTKVGFTLSEASSVKFTVQRKTSGRRVKGKCRTATRGNRSKPKCILWKSVAGSFTVRGKAGKNTFTFRGRVGGKALKPGGYRLNGTATDPSRNASLPKQKAFTIVR